MDHRTKRRYNKLVEKSTWFQQKPREEEENPETKSVSVNPNTTPENEKNANRNEKTFRNVMFITHTRESKLRKAIQSMEDSLNWNERVKYVERSGINLSQTLVQRDPWKGVCGRQECMVCESSLPIQLQPL